MINAKAIKFNNITTILMLTCGFMLLLYSFLAFNAMRVEYTLEELSNRLGALEDDAAELRLELSEVSSLDYVLERSDSLSYTEIESVSYLQKPSASPFAAR
ncbi:MAG: hypothetical protein R3251_03630 [Candidatus Spechtbacterales bacterium]|nr:hypothetical protein [Candidatus Spechtbacterales bacterium]